MNSTDIIDISDEANNAINKLDRVDAVLYVLFEDSLAYGPDYIKDTNNVKARDTFVDDYNTVFTMTHIVSDYVDSVRKDLSDIVQGADEISARIKVAKANL